ncbi:MAG: DEAD/DEAH box helicase family protein [Candidatus Methanomethylophilaceae archaeon]|nr:DEAD/DEAH box helicase family protein [Candidatus Methanomethylophilaceae archaeon]
MKFDFKIQPYQTDAVRDVIDVFSDEIFDECNRYRFDFGSDSGRQRILDPEAGYGHDDGSAYSNHIITLDEDQLLSNIHSVQDRSNLMRSKSLDRTLGAVSLDVEMETGTGKTYVYIKTMFELNKHYGWSKFIVVVPSIAIREGVRKSFEITQDHFMEHYGKKARFFVYDSSNLQKLDDFSQDSGINVMIINSQAFAASMKEGAKNKESRIIYSERDEFQSRRPIDVIAANNPIIILDEPQKLLGDRKKESETLKALREHFNPLFSLNYSATHKVQHNLVHSLDALDAYNGKLVKKIEVKGIELNNLQGTSCYINVQDIVLDPKIPPRARLEIDVKQANGIRRKTFTMDNGDSLYSQSGDLESYRNLFISNIDAVNGYVEFSNGGRLSPGQVSGDVAEGDLRRAQIRETIISHLDKEEKLFKRGIKCLSLFFIDEVAKYRQYDESGDEILGEYGRIFEEEYENILSERWALFDEKYMEHVKTIPVTSTHKGYFSIDKKSRRVIDSKVGKKSEDSDDVDAYDLILKDKERLLSFEEPTRFIFSHSALREGWDNPNVFQICALKTSDNVVGRRQEVGRGLRLCVDSKGRRMDVEECGDLIHAINRLTVIASEGYDTFVKGLQSEISEIIRQRPRKVDKELLTGRRIVIQGEERVIDGQLATRIYQYLVRNDYIDDNDMPTESCRDILDSGNVFIDPDSDLAAYGDAVAEIVRVVIEGGNLENMVDNGLKPRIKENKLNDNFSKREFQELWKEINHRHTYRVEFDSDELIGKSIKAINEGLFVRELSYSMKTGSQKDSVRESDVRSGSSFESRREETKVLDRVQNNVRYDLVGEIAKGANITRRTAASILKGMEERRFDMFVKNPEEFISKISRFIEDEKATLIVDHITYDRLEERYDSSIFTANRSECDPKKAFQGSKHIMDYVFTDGLAEDSVEKRFAQSLDRAEEVAVYAKLPKGFKIPTPVGNYTPDWAIAFDDSKGIRHVYFIAETKGSMDSMQLKPIERAKIHCAEKVYNLEDSKVRYHHVDTYENLLSLIRDME